MSEEQRRHPRHETRHRVVVRDGEADRTGTLRNVSAGGAAIEFAPDLGKSSLELDIGDAVEMRPEGASAVRGTVVRHDPDGVALRFDAAEDDLLETLTRAIDETAPPRRR